MRALLDVIGDVWHDDHAPVHAANEPKARARRA